LFAGLFCGGWGEFGDRGWEGAFPSTPILAEIKIISTLFGLSRIQPT
jgi:hypothetical protein